MLKNKTPRYMLYIVYLFNICIVVINGNKLTKINKNIKHHSDRHHKNWYQQYSINFSYKLLLRLNQRILKLVNFTCINVVTVHLKQLVKHACMEEEINLWWYLYNSKIHEYV